MWYSQNSMLPDMSARLSTLLRHLYSLISKSPNPLRSSLDSLPTTTSLSKDQKLDFLKKADSHLTQLLLCKSASSILIRLLKLFKLHHVLEFEHVCFVLSDLNCQLIFLKLLVSWFPSPANAKKQQQAAATTGGGSGDSQTGRVGNSTVPIGDAWLRAREDIPELK
jgi:hypothetical protein